MPSRRAYDHRVRAAIVASGDANLFPELSIPRSTTDTWIRRGPCDVVGLDNDRAALLVRAQCLEHQLRVLVQVVRLLLALRRVVPGELNVTRLPDGNKKQQLRTIERAREHLSLRGALRIIGLAPARYHAWAARQTTCSLDDRPSCPRTRPGRLSFNEVREIGDMVQLSDFRHMSIRTLALHAQAASSRSGAGSDRASVSTRPSPSWASAPPVPTSTGTSTPASSASWMARACTCTRRSTTSRAAFSAGASKSASTH